MDHRKWVWDSGDVTWVHEAPGYVPPTKRARPIMTPEIADQLEENIRRIEAGEPLIDGSSPYPTKDGVAAHEVVGIAQDAVPAARPAKRYRGNHVVPELDRAAGTLSYRMLPNGAIAFDKGEFKETEHPRGQPKNKGEFVEKGKAVKAAPKGKAAKAPTAAMPTTPKRGKAPPTEAQAAFLAARAAKAEAAKTAAGPAPPKPSPSRGEAFVSPSVASHLDFSQARAGINSQRQHQLARISTEIDRGLGINGTRQSSVIGAWSDGAENSMLIDMPKVNPALARAAMAMKGYLANQKAILLFQPDKDGKHALATFSVYGTLSVIHNNLLQHGLAQHTLEVLPGGDGARVHIFAQTQPEIDAARKAATDLRVPVEVKIGNGDFLVKDNDAGTDEEQRANARKQYEAIIEQAANSEGVDGHNLRVVWQNARDHWDLAQSQAAAGTVAPLPDSKGGNPYQIATRRPGIARPYEDAYRRADMDGYRSDPEQFAHDMELFNDPSGYPNMRKSDVEGKTPDQIAEAMIQHSLANLDFLYTHAPKELQQHGHQWYEGAHEIAADMAKKYGLPLQSAVGVYASQSPQKKWDENVYLGDHIIDIYMTKQNEPWTPEMSTVGRNIWGSKTNPVRDVELKRMFSLIEGKTLAQCETPEMKAAWIRNYDEAHSDRSYPVMAPSGERGAPMMTKAGVPARAAWASIGITANAIRCIESGGDRDVISDAMGDKHKVRSFYNNILDPYSPNDDVCMDTHAVGACLLRPLSGQSTAVAHSLGSNPTTLPPNWRATSSSVRSGIDGTYPIYSEATRRLAEKYKIEPRTAQSITWEAKRGLFPDEGFTKQQAKQVNDEWVQYHNEKQDMKTTQENILKIAGNFKNLKGYDNAKQPAA